jgi:hypothetical protein
VKRMAVVASLALGLLAPPPAGSETRYTCGDGTVRHVRFSTHEERPVYLVTVQLDDLIYTGRFSVDGSFDPAHLVPNDMVFICANDRQLVVDRLDGTDYRGTMIRAERIKDGAGETE